MKIGIDARIAGNTGGYRQYITELLLAIEQINTQHDIKIYTQKNLDLRVGNFFDDTKARKIFEAENFHLMIFFDHHIPKGYRGNFIVMLESLTEVFFPKKKYFERKIFSYKLKRVIKKAKNIVMFDSNSAMELNENLNAPEDIIRHIHGFFPTYFGKQDDEISINIKARHNLKSHYLIYDSGNEIHNNFERILRVIQKLKVSGNPVYLIILCEQTTRDIDIRSKSLELGVSDMIIFHGEVKPEEKKHYYEQSSGVIFSSIYESFPFSFSEAIAYNCRIFANDIPGNTQAMHGSIHLLDPLSIHNMCDLIRVTLTLDQKPDYSEVAERLSPENSARELLNIIDEEN